MNYLENDRTITSNKKQLSPKEIIKRGWVEGFFPGEKYPVLKLKKNEPLPDSPRVIATWKNGIRFVVEPLKFNAVMKKGRIIGWKRKPREDYV